jgi:hypothetical protein
LKPIEFNLDGLRIAQPYVLFSLG